MFCRPWTQRTEVVTAAGLHFRVTGCSTSEMSMSSCCVASVRRRFEHTHAREGHSRFRCCAKDLAWSLTNLMEESEAATFQVVRTQSPLRSVARSNRYFAIFCAAYLGRGRCAFQDQAGRIKSCRWVVRRGDHAHSADVRTHTVSHLHCVWSNSCDVCVRRAEGFPSTSENEDYHT